MQRTDHVPLQRLWERVAHLSLLAQDKDHRQAFQVGVHGRRPPESLVLSLAALIPLRWREKSGDARLGGALR